MTHPFNKEIARLAALGAAGLLTACSTSQSPTPVAADRAAPAAPVAANPATAPAPSPGIVAAAPRATPAPPAAVVVPAPSVARTALAYRRDAASHLYGLNAERIYKGMLQPNLEAVGVLDVDIDRQGQVTAITWRRAPSHVPKIMAEIVRTVRAAAPYPVPARMGKVTYTEIWLWDKSGKFQLDTLTEGQL